MISTRLLLVKNAVTIAASAGIVRCNGDVDRGHSIDSNQPDRSSEIEKSGLDRQPLAILTSIIESLDSPTRLVQYEFNNIQHPHQNQRAVPNVDP